jgi:hypothetical protein
VGAASGALTAGGRVVGGMAPAVASVGPIREASSIAGRAGRVASKGALAVAGGLAGALSGTLDKPIRGGINTYREGRWSVPIYRKTAAEKDSKNARASARATHVKSDGDKK